MDSVVRFLAQRDVTGEFSVPDSEGKVFEVPAAALRSLRSSVEAEIPGLPDMTPRSRHPPMPLLFLALRMLFTDERRETVNLLWSPTAHELWTWRNSNSTTQGSNHLATFAAAAAMQLFSHQVLDGEKRIRLHRSHGSLNPARRVSELGSVVSGSLRCHAGCPMARPEHGRYPLSAVCQGCLLRHLVTRFLDGLGVRKLGCFWCSQQLRSMLLFFPPHVPSCVFACL